MKSKLQTRAKRKMSIRKKVSGTPERPRLTVYRSNSHIYAQLIDDVNGLTIAASSDLKVKGSGINKAMEVGKDLAEKAIKSNVKKIVFDRSGYKYHGRVKALADSAREGGLEF